MGTATLLIHAHSFNVCAVSTPLLTPPPHPSTTPLALTDVLFHLDALATAAGMCFPLETDNIGITASLTTQAVRPLVLTHAPPPSFFAAPLCLLLFQVRPVCCSFPCNGKLRWELAASLAVWQVCVLCQLGALVFLLEEMGREGRPLWVKDQATAGNSGLGRCDRKELLLHSLQKS